MASWHVARVEGSVSGDAGDLLIGRDLVWQIGHDGRVAHVAGGEFGGPDFQRLLVNSYVYLAPYTTLAASVLARSSGKTIRKPFDPPDQMPNRAVSGDPALFGQKCCQRRCG